jgi:hypothetical protein
VKRGASAQPALPAFAREQLARRSLEKAFRGRVSYEPDGSGGAYVTVQGVELSDRFARPTAPLTFQLAYNYPAAAPYPFYLPGDATLSGAWPPALQPIEWRGMRVIQVSLRHNNWDPHRDTAVGCVVQISSWLQAQ